MNDAARPARAEAVLVLCLLALFVCRAVMASAIVPPWQGPDEPVHFAFTQLLAVPAGRVPSARVELERQVLASMAKYRWWEPYGVPTPDPIPTRFEQIGRFGTSSYAQPLYYSVGAAVLRSTQPADAEGAYRHLRALSAVLSLVTLVLGWCGTRLLFGPEAAAGALSIAVLHPQFLLSAITVNPDVVANVLGAFMWWQVARIVRNRRPALSLGLLLIAAAAALLVKDSAIALAAVALAIVAVSMFAPQTELIGRRTLFLGSVAAGIGAAVLVTTLLLFAEPARELAASWRTSLNIRRAFGPTVIAEAVSYVREAIDFVWLAAGWLRLHPSQAWLWVARLITIVGLAGALVLLVRRAVPRRALVMAWLFVGVQVAVIVGLGFLNRLTPQGRFLFPVIAPATALLWLGLTRATPVRFRPYAAPVLLSLVAVLDVTGFTSVLIPAYLPW